MDVDLNDMRFFAEVVERGGFAAAGRALGVPKSRLSRRVAALEEGLGVRLLHRTTRRLSLTDAGEAYLRHCQAMRDAARAASDAVAQVRAEPSGTVRASCPVTLAQTVLAEHLPQFLRRHPKVRLDLQVTNRVVQPVDEGVDVALRVRVSVDDSGGLVVKRLGQGQTVLVASPEQLARQGEPTCFEDLARFDCVSMAARDGRTEWRLYDAQGQERRVVAAARLVADDLLTLKYAVLAGTGAGWLPDYMCHAELEDGRLRRVLPDWSMAPGIVHAVFASRRGLAPAVRAFLDFLGEVVPRHHDTPA